MNQPVIGKRLNAISESVTLKLNTLVGEMKAKGENVINLTAGEPDFHVPEAANTAIIQSVKEHRSKYTPVPGIPELRAEIAKKTNLQQPSLNSSWESKNTVVSNGGKQALFNTFMTLLDPGDEVILTSPYWVTYPEVVRICGGLPVVLDAPFENGFKLKPEQLDAALCEKSRVLVLNSPSNPTGAVYSKEEYRALGDVIRNSKKADRLWIVSDEIYDRICFGEIQFCSFLEANPDLQDRVVTINAMSKSAAMTGWRIGWLVGRDDFVKSVIKLQGQSTSGINSLAQWASVAALKLPESEFFSQIETFKKRRDLLLQTLQKSGKIRSRAPDGAFYAFVGIEECFGKDTKDAVQFAEHLLQEAKVAVVPGNAFGTPAFIRLSFATDERSIQEGCSRLVSFIEK